MNKGGMSEKKSEKQGMQRYADQECVEQNVSLCKYNSRKEILPLSEDRKLQADET